MANKILIIKGPKKAKMMNAKSVREYFGVSAMTIWRWVNSEDVCFPKPIKIGERNFWREEDIEKFVSAKAAQNIAVKSPSGGNAETEKAA